MSEYKYQMHTHTYPCSHCAVMTPKELAKALHKGGYSGCVITNHFFNGNTGIDRHLPWNDFVKQYEIDYLECKKQAENFDLDILFGIEEHIGGGLEILCYGITPDLLYNHPELKERNPEQWFNLVHSCDGIVIQAHPFRRRLYIPQAKSLPFELIDGIEVFNAGNSMRDNLEAEYFADNHPEFICVSGADTHDESTVCLGGIISSQRIKNEKELVKVLKSGKYELIKD